MTWIIGGLAFIFVLGAAVVLHEFGHFAVAKLFKIRVETFSVGFGPRIWGKKWGTTDYRISAIPLGGYVKLGGDESNAAVEGAGDTDIPLEEQYNLRPKWQKILVSIAGPVMNIITAITIPLVAALIFGVDATPAPTVRNIKAGGMAESAGLKVGDKIVGFAGVDSPSWERIRNDSLLSPESPIPMVVERNGQKIQLTITPILEKEGTDKIGVLDFTPDYGDVPIIAKGVVPDSPAEHAGLQNGDRFISIGGQPVHSGEEVRAYIREHKTEPIPITIERRGETKELTAMVGQIPGGGQGLGVVPFEDVPRLRVGLFQSLKFAVATNLEIMRVTGKALAQLYNGKRSARDTLSGPIGIARAASTTANELGWTGVFEMLSYLSLSLGVFNLLPIPVLDGGAIFLILVEAVLAVVGVKLTMNMRERIQQLGFVVLLLLMGFVITNDLIKEASIRFGHSNDKPAATKPDK